MNPTFLSTIPNRFSNAGIALGNIGKTLLHDSSALKTDIAFWATLMHVIMRVQEAYITGEVEPYDAKHKETMSSEEKTYRRNQSAMTYFREIVGVSLGWGVLKVGQAYQKSVMQAKHNYHVGSPYSVSIKQGLSQLWDGLIKNKKPKALPDVFTDTPADVYKKRQFVDPVSQALKHEPLNLNAGHVMQNVDPQLVKWGHMLRSLKTGESDQFIWNKGFLRRVGEFFLPNSEANDWVKKTGTIAANSLEDNAKLLALEKRGFQFAQKFIPTVVWSIPGILLAGVWLERTTLYKGPAVQKWTVSAMEAVGLIDASQDEKQAMVESKQLANVLQANGHTHALPAPPYYYADGVGANFLHSQPQPSYNHLAGGGVVPVVRSQQQPASSSYQPKTGMSYYQQTINRSGFAL